jgi:hypothetical protein
MRNILVCLAVLAAPLLGQSEVAALRELAAARPESPEVHYNLALAEWRAGDLAAAETAIEKYAALAAPPRIELHRGMLGAIRYAEAERILAADSPDLAAARKSAELALEHFVRAAIAWPSPELGRNTERALRLLAELAKRMQQDPSQESSSKDGKERQEGDAQDGGNESQQGNESQPKPTKPGEQPNAPEPPQSGGNPPEPSPESQSPQSPSSSQDPAQGKQSQAGGESEAEGAQRPEPQPQGEPSQDQSSSEQGGKAGAEAAGNPQAADAGAQQAAAGKPRGDAPGEAGRPLRLSQEQAKRLMDQLQKLDAQFQAVRSRSSARRAKVEKDW